jgi:flagellar hook assembly protein FlgD
MIDNAFKRLWIRPRIPSEMDGKISDAILLNPKCHGTLNYEENINDSCTQKMAVSYDDPGVTVKQIVLKNNTGVNTPFVYINGDGTHKVTTSGTGLEKNIAITLKKPILINQNGLKIEVYNKKCSDFVLTSVKGKTIINTIPSAIKSSYLTANKSVLYSVSTGGMISIELLRINGTRIGTIFQKQVTEGHHNFIWNGKTIKGNVVGLGFAVLRLVTPDGSVVKTVVINLFR